MTNFEKVKQFMQTFGQEVKTKASFSDEKTNQLRLDLISEELEELKNAMASKDLLEVADALTDILYVTYGAGHAFGINLDNCFNPSFLPGSTCISLFVINNDSIVVNSLDRRFGKELNEIFIVLGKETL